MNNAARKRIDSIMADIEKTAELRAKIDEAIEVLNEHIAEYKEAFDDAKTMIEELRDEEQEKFDNMSEGLQNSERGQHIAEAVNALDEAIAACENFDGVDDFEIAFDADEIITALDNAKVC